MLRRLIPVVAVGLAVLGYAQQRDVLTVAFEQAGDRRVWVGPTVATAIPSDAIAATGRSVELPVPVVRAEESVFVLDEAKQAVASMPAREALQRGTWNVSPGDFKLLAEVQVEVTHGGNPVASALVLFTTGEEVRRTLLSPEDRGHAKFALVPAGEASVQVEFESEGEMRKTARQTFDLALAEDSGRTIGVVVTDPVETVGQAVVADPGAPAQEVPRDTPRRAPGIAQTLIGILVSIGLLSAIVYGIVLLVKKNPQVLKDALDKAGVATDSGAPLDPPPPVAQVPEPTKPILLGDAQPGPVAVASVPVAPNPRLVRPDGSVVLLQEGETVIGREPGLHFESESTVSRRHAVLICTGGQVLVRDEGSSNGTYVNGVRISADTPLRPGDHVQFGAAKLHFEV